MECMGKPVKCLLRILYIQLLTKIPFPQLQRAFLGALIMVTLGFMVAFLIPAPGEDQYWMNFSIVPKLFSSVAREYPSKRKYFSAEK